MKLISLSEKLLKLMVTEYKKNGTTHFDFKYFKEQYPDETDDFISNAIYALQDDNFVSVLRADNVAYMSTLNPSGIVSCEENTLLKKGYSIIKEIKSLIS